MTVTADGKSKVFGASEPMLTYSVMGLVNGDTASVVTGVSLSTPTGALATAETHNITASGGTAANYAFTDVNGTLTVSQAALIVTANNKSKVYGASDPSLTYTSSGTLYYSDGYSVITGVSLSTTTGAAATARTHTITASGGTAANYDITDVNGILTVSQAALTITTDNKTKVYGAADPALTFTSTGLQYGETASVITAVSLSTTTGAAATAGTHAINAIGGTSANYAITDVNGTLTVSQAALTVTASNKTKVYGAAEPALTFAASGEGFYYNDKYSVITGVGALRGDRAMAHGWDAHPSLPAVEQRPITPSPT